MPSDRYLDIFADIMVSEKASSPPTKIPIDLDELYEWVREKAHQERRSMAELVREAVREYRQRNEPQLELPIRTVSP